jgi:hypothetical protein
MRALITAPLVALTLTFAAIDSAMAEDGIGTVQNVRKAVYGIVPQGARAPVRIEDDIVPQEVLQTAEDSAILIRFEDRSQLTLGAEARLAIDEFAYAEDTDGGKALLRVSAGALRWVTGKLPDGSIGFATPSADLVLHDANIAIRVAPNGDTLVAVAAGEVDVTVKATGKTGTLAAGESVLISPTEVKALSAGIAATGDQIVDLGWPAPPARDNSGPDK